MSTRRLWWLSRMELILFWRNRTAVVSALLLPVATVLLYATISDRTGSGLSANAFLLTGVIGLILMFVVYYNLVTTYVARRDELVLKRLRAGEARDVEILIAGAAPAVVVALAQCAIAVAVGSLAFDLPTPVNPVLLLGGVAGGIVVFALLAAASTAFTRNVEFAQISTLPVMSVCLAGSGTAFPLEIMPDALAQVLRLVPLSPVVELVRLGWVGGADGADFTGSLALAGRPLAILAAWIVVSTVAMRRWFRWEPRR